MRASLYLLLAALTLAYTEKHAVLVAGSNGFTNYRHQADLAHAYSILIDGGVPANNIIVMMYDDIAHSLRNKFKGKLFNRPDAADGTSPPDVYGPVKDHIDYRKHNVTPKNFLKVLTGDTSAPRVLTSGPDDDVFVYFADHGGVGILAFPDAIKFPPVPGKALHADELNDALKTMKSKNMFKRLVFYVEACESGSMFDGLLNASLGVYAVTAANARESSWGWYCDDATGTNIVQGKTMGVCLGDEFSIKWMENTDAADESSETLQTQFDVVQREVNKSHVQRFGDLSFVSSPLATFLGAEESTVQSNAVLAATKGGVPTVDSRDAKLIYLKTRLSELKGAGSDATVEEVTAAQMELAEEEASRVAATRLFKAVWTRVSGLRAEQMLEKYMPPRRFDCHRAVLSGANVQYTDFSLKYHRVVVNLCEMGFAPHAIIEAFATAAGAIAGVEKA